MAGEGNAQQKEGATSGLPSLPERPLGQAVQESADGSKSEHCVAIKSNQTKEGPGRLSPGPFLPIFVDSFA